MAGRGTGFVAIVGIVLGVFSASAAEPTGRALSGLEPFDHAMQGILEKWQVPGGALAVARDGRLVLVRGYGVANRERNEPVTPASLFRLGSLNKVLTSVAILQLSERGLVGLDDKVLPILGEIGPRPSAIRDQRVHEITIRHLLQHTGGFDRDRSGDPLFPPHAVKAAERQGAPMPPTCETILRDSLEGSLDFSPGARYAYSNVGYCILGRVIERIARVPYEAYVRSQILEPSGAARMRLGLTLTAFPGEVMYYDYPGAPRVTPVPGLGLSGLVNRAYGGYVLESFDALGQYIGAPVDFLRIMLAIDGQRGRALLKPETVREMRKRPAIPGNENSAAFYGLGIMVRPVVGGENWFHSGSQTGAKALAVRYAGGNAWVVAFNLRPRDRDGFAGDIDRALIQAGQRVGQNWPRGDLWSEFQ